jgi:uncharacterized protein (TIGR02246 family)
MVSHPSTNPEVNDIRQVALRWTAAVAAADVQQLGRLMTDDIVVIHGNGRIISGREAVMADFARSFENFHVKQTVETEETVLAGDWAFERARVHTSINPRKGTDTREFNSYTVTILRREGSGGWCVARSIGVINQQH